MNPVDVLERAADLLRRQGWHPRGGPRDASGRCVIVAMQDVVRPTGDYAAYRIARDLLHARLDLPQRYSIGDWNDDQPSLATVNRALLSTARAYRLAAR